jgi:glutaredoxin 3
MRLNSRGAAMPEVIVYSKFWCPYCRKAKALLDDKGVDYTEIEVADDPDMETEMIERSGGRTTAPQIFIGDTHVGGCDDLHELEGRGELDKLLQPNS